MKQASTKKVKTHPAYAGGNDDMEEHFKPVQSQVRRQVRTRVTIIGLAISVGASSLLLTRQSDRALADQQLQMGEPKRNTGEVNALLKARQRVLISRLKQKSNRLKGNLTQLGSEKSNNLSAPPTVSAKSSFVEKRNVTVSPCSFSAAVEKTQITDKAIFASLVAGAPLRQQVGERSKEVVMRDDTVSDLKKSENTPSDVVVVLSIPKIAVNEPTVVVPSASLYHQVRAGDTLTAIARHHGISLSALVNANQLADPDELQIKQWIAIPPFQSSGTSGKKVAVVPRLPITGLLQANPNLIAHNSAVDTKQKSLAVPPEPLAGTPVGALPYGVGGSIREETDKLSPPTFNQSQLRKDSPVPATALQPITTVPVNVDAAESLQSVRGLQVFPQLPPLGTGDIYLPKPFDTSTPFKGYIWPAKGVLSSGYGKRWGRMHKGIDIAAPVGTPVVASAPGVVVKAGWTSGGFGKLVVLRHPDGALTRYAHNNRVLVQAGQPVEQGQVVAEMGSTGRSTGPHSHFELHQLGKGAVNPIAYLPR